MIYSSTLTDIWPVYLVMAICIVSMAIDWLWTKVSNPATIKKIVQWFVMSDPTEQFYGQETVFQTSSKSDKLVTSGTRPSLKPYIIHEDNEDGAAIRVRVIPGRPSRQAAFEAGWGTDSEENQFPAQLPKFVLQRANEKNKVTTTSTLHELYGKENFPKKEVYSHVDSNYRG